MRLIWRSTSAESPSSIAIETKLRHARQMPESRSSSSRAARLSARAREDLRVGTHQAEHKMRHVSVTDLEQNPRYREAEGCNSGTSGSQPARRTATSDGGVIT